MRVSRRVLPIFVLVLALSGCSPIKVSTDYDPATDFSRFVTYAWRPHSRTADPAVETWRVEQLQRWVQSAVNESLAAKGMRVVSEQDDPHLVIAYEISSVLRREYRDPYYSQAVVEYREGTLVLDLIDASSDQLVWRGTAQSDVGASSSGKDEALVRKAVSKVLEGYPPAPGSDS